MRTYNYSEAKQNFSDVLNTALKEDVIITRKDGSKFKLISMNEKVKQGKSPLEDIKGVNVNVSMKDIIDAIRDGRDERGIDV
ncbi:MAG: type II toxin-antitoxin system Phd/YefM family antitoxin [Planctomycetaceae bacterium]|nr:type II toxin-antitoxin system Phd/YefM family antitoxin [Planctomycetaceae bacterium]